MAVLVQTREEAGLTQRQLAKRLGRAHSYVSRIELGDRRLDVPEFFEWCELLGEDPVRVFGRIARK